MKTKTILLFSIINLIALTVFAQTKTIGFGSNTVDYIHDFTTNGHQSFFIGDLSTNNADTTITVADSNYKVVYGAQHLLAIDKNNQLTNALGFKHPNGLSNQITDGKIIFDSITNSIYIAGVYRSAMIIGNDTLADRAPSVFLARLDTNLTPIWARSDDCSINISIEIRSLTLDDQGKPWVAIELFGNNEKVCIGGDSLYYNGRFYADSSGNIAVSKSYYLGQFAQVHENFRAMQGIDSSRIIELFWDTLQMIDSNMDTVLWNISIPFERYTQMAVDQKSQMLYVTAPNGTLYKYDYAARNLVWQTTNTAFSNAMGLEVSDNGERVYLYGNEGLLKKIHVIDSSSQLLQSTIWGIHTFDNTSLCTSTSFKLKTKKLYLTFEAFNDTIIFGRDSFYSPKHTGRCFFSGIDLATTLTELANHSLINNLLFLYPNPTKNGMFFVKSEEPIIEISCYNLQGKLVTISNISTNQCQLNSDAPRGVYLVRIRTNKSMTTKKLIY